MIFAHGYGTYCDISPKNDLESLKQFFLCVVDATFSHSVVTPMSFAFHAAYIRLGYFLLVCFVYPFLSFSIMYLQHRIFALDFSADTKGTNTEGEDW